MRGIHRFLAGKLFYPCVAASGLALALLVGRAVLTGSPAYRFLAWNLFLAWLPYLAALSAAVAAGPHGALESRANYVRPPDFRPYRAIVPGVLWLLFLPNAPYLMTDFVHLPGMTFVWWYEIGMLLAFAWAGCLLGVASLHMMQAIVRAWAGAAASWVFVLTSVGLSGVGIYLGRFLRWNSWDVVTSPRALARELLAILADPASYPRLMGVSGLFACFLLLGYLTLVAVRRAE